MHPVLLTLDVGGADTAVRAYGTFHALALILAVTLGTWVARRRGFSWWRVLITFSVALAIGVVGARLLDLGVNWGYYSEDLTRTYALGFRGFSLDGGLVLAVAAGLFLSRAFRLPVWRLADSAVPALALGIVVMRVGCFLNGCCFGVVTSLPWGVSYPTGSPAWAHQLTSGMLGLPTLSSSVQPVHPTQIYEMVAAAILGGCAVWLMTRRDSLGKTRYSAGVPFLVFALGFTVFRLGNNFLRVQLPTVAAPSWSYPVYFMAVGTGIAVLLVWRLRHDFKEKTTHEHPIRPLDRRRAALRPGDR